jgi:hypothetical protein
MKPIWMFGIASLALAQIVSASEPFDGSQPMNCKPSSGFDCLPGQSACKQLQPESGKDLTMLIDIHAKALKTPYKKDPLPIASVSFNTASLVLQGTSLEFAWSATVHRTTGALKIAVVDREGTYVVFGQCAAASGKAPAPPQNAPSGPAGVT